MKKKREKMRVFFNSYFQILFLLFSLIILENDTDNKTNGENNQENEQEDENLKFYMHNRENHYFYRPVFFLFDIQSMIFTRCN